MDNELKAFLRQQFSDLEQRIDQRFQASREETAQQFSAFDQRFQASREETAQQFSSFEQRIDQRLQTSREETAQSFLEQRIDQRSTREETAQQIQALRKEMSQRFDKVEEEVRHAHVSIEGLRGEIRLVAEGVANANERLDRRIGEVLRKIDEVDARHRSAYQSLEIRVRKLEGAA